MIKFLIPITQFETFSVSFTFIGKLLLLHSVNHNELTQRKDKNKILKKEKGEME